MARRIARVLVGTVSLVLVASVARAQSAADKSAAVALFDDAERLAAAGNFRDACPKYAESNRLDPQLGALLHLADCYERAGQLASAWASFRDAAEISARRGDPRAETAEQRAVALEPRLAKLSIVVPPEAAAKGLEVKRDGVAVSSAIWGSAIPVDPGEHAVEASAPGKVTWKGTVTVAKEGSAESVSIPVLVDAPPDATPAATPDKGAPSDTGTAGPAPGSTQRLLAWSAIGAGGIALGLGVVFQIKKGSKISDRDAICPSNKCTPEEAAQIKSLTEDARSANTLGTVMLVTGGLLAAGGAALLFTAPHGDTQVAMAPAVGPGFQGLVVKGSIW